MAGEILDIDLQELLHEVEAAKMPREQPAETMTTKQLADASGLQRGTVAEIMANNGISRQVFSKPQLTYAFDAKPALMALKTHLMANRGEA